MVKLFLTFVYFLHISQQVNGVEITFDTTKADKYSTCCLDELRSKIEAFYTQMSSHFSYKGYTPPSEIKFILEIQEDAEGHGIGGTWQEGVYTAFWSGKEDTINPEVTRMIVEASFWSIESFPSDKAKDWLTGCFVNYAYMYLYDTANQESKERPDTSDKSKTPKNAASRECAYWMNYVVNKYPSKPDVSQKVFKMVREAKYNDNVWKKFTGKTVKQLWDAME